MQEETARPAVNSPPHLTVAPLKAFIPTGECLMNLGVIFHVKKKKKNANRREYVEYIMAK